MNALQYDEAVVRKIIHVDMDAFFAAVEIRDNPQLKGKPVIVGGAPGSRSVVSTCSYEARKYGVHSAMSSTKAAKLCPHAVFVHGRFEVYAQVAKQIREIFDRYSPVVESVSLDEAYLDVTSVWSTHTSATAMARAIKNDIRRVTGLTASAGVSYNKFMAKIGSELNKPDGLTVIPPQEVQRVLDRLPIGKFHGIGDVTEARMISLGIRNGAELRQCALDELKRHFGKAGEFYYNIVRGYDPRPVSPYHERKSIGCENTFPVDYTDLPTLKKELKACARKVAARALKHHKIGYTLTLKIKHADFEQHTKSRTFELPFADKRNLKREGVRLLKEAWDGHTPIRLLGLSLSSLEDTSSQGQLFFGF